MIVAGLIDALIAFICAVINAFPSFPVLTWVSSNAQFIQWCAWANYYLPMSDFVACLSSVVSCWIISSAVRVVIDLL